MTWTIRSRRGRNDRSAEDALFALGDSAVSGAECPIESELGDTLLCVQRTLDNSSATLEATTRHRMWEDIMHAHVENSSVPIDGIRRHAGASGPPFRSRRPSPLATTVARWQPAVSLFMVAAFLVSLTGLAWDRGVLDDLGMSQQPASELDPFMPDRPTPAEFPASSATCAPRTEERLSEDELRAHSIKDWFPPSYNNARPASPEIAQMAIDTSLGYLQCEFAQYSGTPSVTSEAFAARQTYLSDRMRYLLLYDTLSPAQQREVDDFLADNPSEKILEGFPLPVNRDFDRFIASGDGSFFVGGNFMAGEVYQLPDGRLGAITGSISTQRLVEQRPVHDSDGAMTFIAFWPEDGQLYIDELLTICVPGPSPFPTPDATPVSAETIEGGLGLPEYAACT